MKRKTRPVRFGLGGAAAAIILSFAAFGSGGGSSQPGNAANPLIEEMRVLDGVFRDVVSGVALNDGPRVHAAIEKMHGTMERTHEGVSHGTVKLKKNANRLSDFIRQDKQFHGTLEALAGSARRNDSAAMLSLTKKLLDGCITCHRDFR